MNPYIKCEQTNHHFLNTMQPIFHVGQLSVVALFACNMGIFHKNLTKTNPYVINQTYLVVAGLSEVANETYLVVAELSELANETCLVVAELSEVANQTYLVVAEPSEVANETYLVVAGLSEVGFLWNFPPLRANMGRIQYAPT